MRQIEFPSILLPPDISSGSIVDINVEQNTAKEAAAEKEFADLQEQIYLSFGASEPATPVLRCRNATQTSVVLEWDPIELATANLLSLSLYRNGQKAGNIPKPLQMHSTKISGLAVDTKYVFHLVLKTSAGTFSSEKVQVSTHKMTDLSGITITTGFLPASVKENLTATVERIGAKIVDGVRIDTTHFVTTEGRGQAWEKASESNIPVVRPEWVDACEKNGRILGVTKFYLDAMRPGPSDDTQSQSPAVSQKELPTVPPTAEEAPKESSEADADKQYAPLGGSGEKAADEEDSSEEDDENAESEQKSRTVAPEDEQKVLAGDVEGQKLALRPANSQSAASGDSAEGEDKSDDDDDDDEKESKEKGSTQSPDNSSFQDVQL